MELMSLTRATESMFGKLVSNLSFLLLTPPNPLSPRCPSREDFPLIETEDEAYLRRIKSKSTHRARIKNLWYIHTMEYGGTVLKNEMALSGVW